VRSSLGFGAAAGQCAIALSGSGGTQDRSGTPDLQSTSPPALSCCNLERLSSCRAALLSAVPRLSPARAGALLAAARRNHTAMTRPKAPKARPQGPTGATGARPVGEGAEQQQQQQQQQQQADKKRPEAAAGAGAAAAAAAGGGEQVEVDQLERKRMQVADELRQVERQVRRGVIVQAGAV